MPEYRLTPAAKSDLLEIWNYSVETWGEKQAEIYLLYIGDGLETLASNPELGRQRPEICRGYYSFPIGEHVVFYLQNRNYIDIIGLLHGRMDFKNNLF